MSVPTSTRPQTVDLADVERAVRADGIAPMVQRHDVEGLKMGG